MVIFNPSGQDWYDDEPMDEEAILIQQAITAHYAEFENATAFLEDLMYGG